MSDIKWRVVLINHQDDITTIILDGVSRGEAIDLVETEYESGGRIGRRFTKQSIHNWIATKNDEIAYSVRIERIA
jgi:hypothetical protein